MSAPTDPSAAAIVDTFRSEFIGNYCEIAGIALTIYEWTITSDQTVKMFWSTKPTGATVLFLANRYIFFAFNLLTLFGYLRMSDKSCTILVKSTTAIEVCLYVPWAVFSASRVLALGRSWLISSFVLLLSLAPFGMNFIQFNTALTGVSDPNFGCTAIDNTSPELAKTLFITSRTCLIASDVIVIAITWYTTSQWRIFYTAAGQNTPTLSLILLRDGTIYFVVLLILNTLHLALSLLSIDGPFQAVSYIVVFTQPITAVVVSRFLLNLQSAHRKMVGVSTTGPTLASRPTDSLVFARIVGSMGSPTMLEDTNARDLNLDEDQDEDGDESQPADSSDGQLGLNEAIISGAPGRSDTDTFPMSSP